MTTQSAANWSENERTDVRRLPIGSIVSGRYKIERVLGSGGFAVVYQAYDPLIDRRVALKVLELHHQTQDADLHRKLLVQFRQEAQSAARIQHPNVVTIHDMGVTEKTEQPFIIMELLDGHDLGAEFDRFGPMHPTRAIPLFVKALQALGVGHRMQVVHKDLKPGNVFLTSPHTEDEDIRVVDFGIARLGTEAAQIYGPDVVVGTPRYIAPELLRQQQATPAVDVYQMALILGECLSGNPLVPDDDVEVCTGRHLRGEVFVPVHLQATELEPILHKALARKPGDRFKDATGFCRALETVDPAKIPQAQWDPSALLVRSEKTTTGISARDTLLQTGPTFTEPGAASVSIMLRTPWKVGSAVADEEVPVPVGPPPVPEALDDVETGVRIAAAETRPSAGPWLVAGFAVLFAALMALLLAIAIVAWPTKPALAPEAATVAPAAGTADDAATPSKTAAPENTATDKVKAAPDEAAKPALEKSAATPVADGSEDGVDKKTPPAGAADKKEDVQPAKDVVKKSKASSKGRTRPRVRRPPRVTTPAKKKGTERPRGLIPD